MAKINNPISKSLALILRAYQYCISPLYASCCRFHPTCSSYAIEAIQTHSVWKGCYLIVRRILRCHPWHTGGLDPVPEK